MGLHMVALGQLKLLSSTSAHTLTPMVLSLLWPYILKLSFSSTFIRRAYMQLFDAARFFFFQLHQIAFESQPAFGNDRRLERAFRVVCQRLTGVRRPTQMLESEEDALRTLSLLAL